MTQEMQMARTTSTLVGLLLGNSATHSKARGDWDGETDLDQFIGAATVVVDEVAACADRKVSAGSLASDLTDTELELIERWLSAHCYALNDQTLASKNTRGAGGTFHGQTGMHLESTRYGQMAMTLDRSGCLAALHNRARARAVWMGKRPSAQVDYDQRD